MPDSSSCWTFPKWFCRLLCLAGNSRLQKWCMSHKETVITDEGKGMGFQAKDARAFIFWDVFIKSLSHESEDIVSHNGAFTHSFVLHSLSSFNDCSISLYLLRCHCGSAVFRAYVEFLCTRDHKEHIIEKQQGNTCELHMWAGRFFYPYHALNYALIDCAAITFW